MDINILITDDTGSYDKEQMFVDCAEMTFKVLGETFGEDSKVGFDDCEISLLLTDDARIHELNKEYREKDKPTDVLSFPMAEDPFEEGGMLGDIVISVETAKEQAKDADITLDREVSFLFIHGLLHLMGLDHETSTEDEEEMFDLQENILRNLLEIGKVP
ncbi:MAG: rRNA maturation RNase YbeY [Deferribacterales bacterium]